MVRYRRKRLWSDAKNRLSPNPKVSNRRSSKMCAVVEQSDHHYGGGDLVSHSKRLECIYAEIRCQLSFKKCTLVFCSLYLAASAFRSRLSNVNASSRLWSTLPSKNCAKSPTRLSLLCDSASRARPLRFHSSPQTSMQSRFLVLRFSTEDPYQPSGWAVMPNGWWWYWHMLLAAQRRGLFGASRQLEVISARMPKPQVVGQTDIHWCGVLCAPRGKEF